MSDFDDVDNLSDVLRSGATPAELADEQRVVALMASNHPNAKGSTMFTSRRARIATLVAAGVIGFGGVAAAGPGGFDFDTPDDVEVVEEPADDAVPDDSVPDDSVPDDSVPDDSVPDDSVPDDSVPDDSVPDDSVPVDSDAVYGEIEDPNAATAFNEAYCREGNHGKTVSAVAKGEPPFEEVEVVDAAHSDCGKTGGDPDGTDDDIDDDDSDGTQTDDVDVDRATIDEPDRHAAPGRAGKDAAGQHHDNRGGNGNGNGKGDGNGRNG